MTTFTILHPQPEVNAIAYYHAISKSVCTRTQANKFLSRQPVCLTDSDNDYILEEIGRREKIILKEMWKFIVRMRKINMIILNEYYMYLI